MTRRGFRRSRDDGELRGNVGRGAGARRSSAGAARARRSDEAARRQTRARPETPARDEPAPAAHRRGRRAIRRAYASLEVPAGSDFETVRKSYRRFMRKYHPDLHGGTPEALRAANDLTQRLTQAYKMLEEAPPPPAAPARSAGAAAIFEMLLQLSTRRRRGVRLSLFRSRHFSRFARERLDCSRRRAALQNARLVRRDRAHPVLPSFQRCIRPGKSCIVTPGGRGETPSQFVGRGGRAPVGTTSEPT